MMQPKDLITITQSTINSSESDLAVDIVISYPDAVFQYVHETWPLLMTRIIELSTDFISMAMLADIDSEVLSATSLISSLQIVLRSVNATFLFYSGVKTAIAVAAGHKKTVGSILKASWIFAAGLSIPAAGLAYFSAPILKILQQPDLDADIAQQYLRAFTYGLPFTLMSIASQQVAFGLKEAKLVLAITALTRPLALVIGYGLIYGAFGLPTLGVAGLGYANSLSYTLNYSAYLIALAFAKKFQNYGFRQCSKAEIYIALNEIIRKGIPIGAYASVELGSLLYSTILTGRLGARNLAALQPALQYCSLLANTTFAFGTSTGIMVGRTVAQKQFTNAIRFGNISNIFCLFVPLIFTIVFFSIGNTFMRPFINTNNDDTELLRTAYLLLAINLIGQLFDGLRNSSTGILRGYQNTFTPMLINLLTMLLINVPLAAISAFALKNVEGILFSRTLAIAISAFAICTKQILTSYTAENMADTAPVNSNKALANNWQFYKPKKSKKADTEWQPLLNEKLSNSVNKLAEAKSRFCNII